MTTRQRLAAVRSRAAAVGESLRSRAAPVLGIDPRALGAFRIALALLLLTDWVGYRRPAVPAFYTDDGVLPRSTLAELYPALEAVSIHALSGTARFQYALLALAVAAAVCLLVGYRTRAATAVSLVLLASLYARNPYVINGGNTILVAFLFLALYLPLDARWSLGTVRASDTARGGESASPTATPADRRICSLATAVTLLTLVSIYAANVVSKVRSGAWLSGVAVPRIFHLDEFIVRLGPLLSEHTPILTLINWLWIALLAGSVFLLARDARLRAGAALAFVAAHLGMAATMRLGVFPFVMISVLLLFFPPAAWDAVEALAGKLPLPSRLTRPGYRSDGGRSKAPAEPTLPRLRYGIKLGATVILVAAFVALVGWQAMGVGLVDLPESTATGELAEVSWSFFAPNPPDTSSWYVVRATLESGETVDAFGREAAGFDRPPDAAATYPTTLWHQFGHRIRYAGETQYRPIAAYACERAGPGASSVTVYHVVQTVDSAGPVGEPEPQKRISAAC